MQGPLSAFPSGVYHSRFVSRRRVPHGTWSQGECRQRTCCHIGQRPQRSWASLHKHVCTCEIQGGKRCEPVWQKVQNQPFPMGPTSVVVRDGQLARGGNRDDAAMRLYRTAWGSRRSCRRRRVDGTDWRTLGRSSPRQVTSRGQGKGEQHDRASWVRVFRRGYDERRARWT